MVHHPLSEMVAKQAITATLTTRAVANTWGGSETVTSFESRCFSDGDAASMTVLHGREHKFYTHVASRTMCEKA